MSAAYAAGAEVTPPSWEEQVVEFDEALDRAPAVLSERDQTNQFWRRELGVA